MNENLNINNGIIDTASAINYDAKVPFIFEQLHELNSELNNLEEMIAVINKIGGKLFKEKPSKNENQSDMISPSENVYELLEFFVTRLKNYNYKFEEIISEFQGAIGQ